MIRRAIAAAALMVLAVPIHPQQTARFSIQGTIAAEKTDQPLSGVQVALSKDAERGTVPPTIEPVFTDDLGRFVFKDLDEGTYRLGAIKNGYVRGYYSNSIDLKGNPQNVDVTLRVTAAATLSGHVRDTLGRPMADVPVELLRRTYNRDGRYFQTSAQTQTNDLGEYRLYWITPGVYYLASGSKEPSRSDRFENMALDSNLLNGRNSVKVDHAYRYFPGVSEIDKATKFDIQPGSVHTDLDFTVEPTRFYRIRGTVIDSSTNRPPTDVGFSWSGGGNPHYDAETGTFEIINCPPGAYAISLEHDSLFAFTRVTVGNSDVDGIALLLEPGAIVSGRVRTEGTLRSERLQGLRVQLLPAGESSQGDSVEVNADGTFTFEDVPRAGYRVRLFAVPSGFYLKEARLGGADAAWNVVPVAGSTDLQIVISSRIAQLHGVAAADPQLPRSGIEVALIPAAPNRNELIQSVLTDQDGRFNFSRITPGDYKLFAFDGLERFAFVDPEVLAQFEERGTPIHLTESSDETVNLTAIPAGSTR